MSIQTSSTLSGWWLTVHCDLFLKRNGGDFNSNFIWIQKLILLAYLCVGDFSWAVLYCLSSFFSFLIPSSLYQHQLSEIFNFSTFKYEKMFYCCLNVRIWKISSMLLMFLLYWDPLRLAVTWNCLYIIDQVIFC
jgi:hypothetical protein